MPETSFRQARRRGLSSNRTTKEDMVKEIELFKRDWWYLLEHWCPSMPANLRGHILLSKHRPCQMDSSDRPRRRKAPASCHHRRARSSVRLVRPKHYIDFGRRNQHTSSACFDTPYSVDTYCDRETPQRNMWNTRKPVVAMLRAGVCIAG